MRLLLLSLICCFLIISCKNEQPTSENVPKAYTTTAPVSTYTVAATFVDAQIYTGTSRFVFKDETGELINVDIPNLSKGEKINLPGNLLENTNQGPPSANPQLLGKAFELEYDRVSSKIVAVRQKKE